MREEYLKTYFKNNKNMIFKGMKKYFVCPHCGNETISPKDMEIKSYVGMGEIDLGLYCDDCESELDASVILPPYTEPYTPIEAKDIFEILGVVKHLNGNFAT